VNARRETFSVESAGVEGGGGGRAGWMVIAALVAVAVSLNGSG
jgi:hypothetical protein